MGQKASRISIVERARLLKKTSVEFRFVLVEFGSKRFLGSAGAIYGGDLKRGNPVHVRGAVLVCFAALCFADRRADVFPKHI